MSRLRGHANCVAYGHRGDAVRVPYSTDGRDAEECDRDGNLTGWLLREYKIACYVCGETMRTTIRTKEDCHVDQ